jgi:hypothetical protein
MSNPIKRISALAARILAHGRLPLALALAAVILMLPALRAGLFGDDLIQRLTQLKGVDLPPRAVDTGFVPPNSGELGTVVSDLFGYLGRPEAAAKARDYGIMPWWAPHAWQAALWRPLTAFTHWIDYRLFPKTPVLMHAHNIAWYAAAVFLAAICYRKLGGQRRFSGAATEGRAVAFEHADAPGLTAEAAPGDGRTPLTNGIAAALAAVLFLLDKNMYGPVTYVANRGFIVALVFGLASLYAHHRWRTTRGQGYMWLSVLCLLLALLANEGGASTLAFLLAYALVLEPGRWRSRLGSLLPAAAVVVGWRAVYTGWGFGVRNFVGYIDPGYAPLRFLKNLGPRLNALLGGQLTGIPPEINFGLSPQMKIVLAVAFAGFSLACALVFLPILRRDAVARFWAAVMVLALVPAATVTPLSKNLGFVAVGAFGVTAAFFQHFCSRKNRAALSFPVWMVSWCVAIWLLVAHVPGALAARLGLAVITPYIPLGWEQICTFEGLPEFGEHDVVIVNDPAPTGAAVPFDRAYRGQPLPRSIRTLAPGLAGMIVNRPDARTLVLTANGTDLFGCPALGPLHVGYGIEAGNDFLFGGRSWSVGERVAVKGFVAEVLELSPDRAPRSVAFRFDQPLEAENMVWLWFNWRRQDYERFTLPKPGGTSEIAGPRGSVISNQ